MASPALFRLAAYKEKRTLYLRVRVVHAGTGCVLVSNVSGMCCIAYECFN